ncbi:GcrA family cell cycle regulator [Mesorhizobium sp. BAC0120]|uniref:GcrA family cell cycle regulator n=1 Tax=Mesorhizobium sp. BAC0120 TaxID=3090670 RepID=UPI00399BCC29
MVQLEASSVPVLTTPLPSNGQVKDKIPLMALGRGQCRFPVCEDPSVPGGHLFCAQATSPDAVYCAHHHRIATTVEPRRSGSTFIPQRRAA